MSFHIPPSAAQEDFVHASGPGGQNDNNVSSAVQLRCDTTQIVLSDDVRARLKKIAGSKMTEEGMLILKSQTFRTQERNRAAAWTQLEELIKRAHIKPKPRKATKPTRASQERRISEKKRRGETKSLRRQNDF